MEPILINGEFRSATVGSRFTAHNPAQGPNAAPLPGEYPVSTWADLDRALDAAQQAFEVLLSTPRGKIADFLEHFASGLEAQAAELAKIANEETGLPFAPRLKDVELPRTVNQLRLSAKSARRGEWAQPVIDTKGNLRTCLGPLGPVAVFGPNNFPFAYNGIAGGDFASAIAAGNPVIAKAHPLHPGTTLAMAKLALAALKSSGLPAATVQMFYDCSREDGARLLADPRLAGLGFTGSRTGGLALKKICDEHGKPGYFEMSSINPVVILPGALQERGAEVVKQFVESALMGAGQFCTNPGLVFLLQDAASSDFLAQVKTAFESAPNGTLLSASGLKGLSQSVDKLRAAGAELVCGGGAAEPTRCAYKNTLLQATGEKFLKASAALQTEAFGNASLFVVCANMQELLGCLRLVDGSLTACVYSANSGSDDDGYQKIAPVLRQKAGRLMNDKMPTGVAVSPAQNHGGPYPSSGHPIFSAVGVPVSLRRFAMLQCYDNVRAARLPDLLRDENPTGCARCVDGVWTSAPIKKEA